MMFGVQAEKVTMLKRLALQSMRVFVMHELVFSSSSNITLGTMNLAQVLSFLMRIKVK